MRTGVPPRQFSPYHNLDSDLPPTIIFHGTKDTTMPYDSVELFTEQAKKKGNAGELVGYEDQGHGFFNYKETRMQPFIDKREVIERILRHPMGRGTRFISRRTFPDYGVDSVNP